MIRSSFCKYAFLGLCAVALLTQGAGAAEPIARIGDTEVKVEEIRATLDTLDARQRAVLERDPALLNQLVRSFLMQKLVLKEALEKRWEQQPAVVAQLERVRETAITESYLQSVSKPAESFPSDAELQAAYEASKAAFLMPREFRVAQIYIAAPKGADKETLEKAQAKLDVVRKKLKQPGADFAALAKAESDEKESASRGGEIGWLPEPRIQPEIRAVVTGLEKNAISDPVRADDGWHILKVLDVKDAYTASLNEVRPQLVQQLRVERTRANSQAYMNKLLQENPVAINELALSSILKPAK